MAAYEVNAATVAELRRETGAGMMDCKKALQEAKGDKEAALAWLRKKGIAAAEKRAERSANEGVVAFAQSADGETASLVEINSETDFVAKSDAFRDFADHVAKVVLNWKDASGKTLDDLKRMSLPSGVAVGDALNDLTGKIGEKLEIRRFIRVSVPDGFVGHYIHTDNKLGVMVVLEGLTGMNSEAHQLGRDLAMQVAAASPTVIRREEIPAAKVDAERAIEIERARSEGKPEAAVSKIAEGRINKWFAEVALLEQPYIKDPKVTVKQMVDDASKRADAPVTVTLFVRFRVGA